MLYVLYGPDSFSRHEAFVELKARLDEDGALTTNTGAIDGRQAIPEEVMAACSTVPFLGSHRLVVVEGLLESMSGSGRRGRKKATPSDDDLGRWQALVDYLPHMPPSTTLVFLDGGLKSAPPLVDALAGKGEIRAFPALGPKDLPGWLQRRARRIGVQLDGRAASLLAQTAGNQKRDRAEDEYNDLWALANELDKLAAAVPDGIIREKQVLELTPVMRDQKGYFLRDAIIDGRSAAAVKVLHELLDQGDNPQAIIGLIAAAFRRLAVARDMLDGGASGAAVGRALRSQGYGLERLLDQASRYPLDRIRQAYRRIVEADFDHKRGLCDEGLSLELLVQDLSTPAGRPSRVA
jgi:DNA polymerase-3 subunit delta